MKLIDWLKKEQQICIQEMKKSSDKSLYWVGRSHGFEFLENEIEKGIFSEAIEQPIPKKVFILLERGCFESEDDVIGVYLTLEAAEKAKENLEVEYKELIEKGWCDGFYFQEFELKP